MGGRFRCLNRSDTGLSANRRGSSYWTVGSDRGKIKSKISVKINLLFGNVTTYLLAPA